MSSSLTELKKTTTVQAKSLFNKIQLLTTPNQYNFRLWQSFIASPVTI